jgi:hypothetical protein
LDKGRFHSIGETGEIINSYLSSYAAKKTGDGYLPQGISLHGTGEIRFTRFLTMKDNVACDEFFFGDTLILCIEIEAYMDLSDVSIDIYVLSVYGDTVMMVTPDPNYKPRMIEKGKHRIHVLMDELLMPGEYSFHLSLAKHKNGASIDFIESAGAVKIFRDSLDPKLNYPWVRINGHVKPRSEWTFDKH